MFKIKFNPDLVVYEMRWIQKKITKIKWIFFVHARSVDEKKRSYNHLKSLMLAMQQIPTTL